ALDDPSSAGGCPGRTRPSHSRRSGGARLRRTGGTDRGSSACCSRGYPLIAPPHPPNPEEKETVMTTESQPRTRGGARVGVQRFGTFLSGMIMPNIAAFIAWGLITALFIPTGWTPNETLA